MTTRVRTGRTSRRYELGLLALLSLANGFVALDRLTASYLSPYIVADLGLSNTQLGLLAASLSLAVAISAFWLGRVADTTGRRKTMFVLATVAFSLFSALSGLAAGFLFLFGARFLLGLAEGPMVPISQAVMADESDPRRRGLNMGVMQMSGAFLLGAMIGPVLVTSLADLYGWRVAFFLSGVPGLLLALSLFFYMRPDAPRPVAAKGKTIPLGTAIATFWRIGNMRASIAIAALFSAWLMIQNVFLPVYLTQVKGLAPATMGWVLGMGGLAGIVGGTLLPWLSDRIGRKPVCAIACFAGIGTPLALLLLPSSPVLLGLAILIGWLPVGIAPLYCAVIPSESVPAALTTSAIGLSMGTAELLGGVVAPFVAGRAADALGLEATLWLCMICAIAAGLFCLGLRETAPGRAVD
ncbi:MAG TPA: MFS transporter [Sphingomonadaceae bacterium]|nr:MFS transporter [Sphingomonadaceae bacterium]